MTISSPIAISGTGLAAELRELVHQLSNELAQSARQTDRSAREIELREGLLAAEETHNKASAIATGAWISGVLTCASGAGQLYGSTQFRCATETDGQSEATIARGTTALNAYNNGVQSKISAVGTLSPIGSAIDRGFSAIGEHAESRAEAHRAHAKGAAHDADEAASDRQTANKMDESARQLWQEMNRTRHAAMMAIFTNR